MHLQGARHPVNSFTSVKHSCMPYDSQMHRGRPPAVVGVRASMISFGGDAPEIPKRPGLRASSRRTRVQGRGSRKYCLNTVPRQAWCPSRRSSRYGFPQTDQSAARSAAWSPAAKNWAKGCCDAAQRQRRCVNRSTEINNLSNRNVGNDQGRVAGGIGRNQRMGRQAERVGIGERPENRRVPQRRAGRGPDRTEIESERMRAESRQRHHRRRSDRP